MEEQKIEKGVPMPGALWKTMMCMEIGDSFLTAKSRAAVQYASEKAGINTTSRKEGDAYRVWRTA